MSRIAVIADVHGNVPALEAVLADLDETRPDEVLVGGDLVGRGPQGSRVIELVRERGWGSVKGNHEDYLLDFREGRVPDEWLFDGEWAASRWMAAELTADDAAYIASLPFSITSALEPELRLVHGSPSSANEGLGPWCTRDQLEAFADLVEEPLLVCAHTHRPLEERFDDGRLVVNVGSVGLPFNRDHRAQYAIFERCSDGWRVEPRRVSYDLHAIREIYRSTGFLEAGGITARLLALELEHATPILVPFLEWAKASGIPAAEASLDDFLGFFSPGEPLRVFVERLQALAGHP
jgi:diadenosine tetraphosphatase ApaH/serine/threonine PP2A family protein phosphatase